jgi:acyl-CoA reductase-like NAD-dependent aldehyde dehydrogenase
MEAKPNLIAGEWRSGADRRVTYSPSNLDEVIGCYTQATREDVDQAVAAAQAAANGWARITPQARHDLLDRVGNRLIAAASELGLLLSGEEGKTLPEGKAEVLRAGQIFKFFAGECLRPQGQFVPSLRPGVDIELTREPIGVVGLITPWNFPIAIPAWKLAPALAWGNCVVIKPADIVPGCTQALVSILHDEGCPPGVVNLVMGRGSEVGQAMVEHPGIAAISFTGSQGVGQRLIAECAARGKRVQAEMGGKNPMVVLDDADMDVAVAACVNSAFFSTGQRCTAASRLIVTRGIHDRLVSRLKDELSRQVIGHAFDPRTTIGPVASSAQLQTDLDYIALGGQEGAQVWGGDLLDRAERGYYLAPALFLGATNHMRVSREEIFGPCAAVIEAENFEHALHLANDTEFGLSAGICTSSLKLAREFRRQVQSGMVMVNLPTAGVDYHVPFGGRKGSSYGPREQGAHSAEFYSQLKTSYISA